jgi:hypothetical protein
MADVQLIRPRAWGRRLAGGTSALAMALFVAVVVAAPSQAARSTGHGYWWRLQSTLGPALRAPGVPEGGLWVMADPSGDQAVSALRITPEPGETITALTLTVAETVGTPTIAVCPSAGTWTPVDGGDWEERPEADCAARRAQVTIDEAGTATVPLAFLGGGPVDVVLVPEPDAFFSVSFESPATGTIAVANGPAAPAAPAPRPAASAAGAPAPTVAPRLEVGDTYRPPPAGFAAPVYDDAPSPVRPAQVPVASTARPVDGVRHPAALLAVAIVAAAWWYRLRAATRAAAGHPLAAGNVAFGRRDPDEAPA